jgi:23S rRNA (uracil1939-C5)-methyltransferase
VELTISALAQGGEGVGREATGPHVGRVVFVAGAAPGDRALVALTEQKRRWARGRLVSLVEPGPGRTEPFCPLSGTCGGCSWQHVELAEQRAQKHAFVRRVAERLGGADALVPPLFGGRGDRWRQRVRVRFTVRGGAVTLGFLAERSHGIVDVPACPVSRPGVDAGLAALRRALGGLTDASGTAVIAVDDADRPLVSVRISSGSGRLAAAEVLLAGLVALPGAVVEADGQRWEHGEQELSYPGMPWLRVRAGGFTQANPEVALRIVSDVLDLVGREQPRLVVELFAGAGTFTLPLAERVERVVALESDPAAVADLVGAASRQSLDVDARVADLRAPSALAALADDPPDLVVLDPPREGAPEVAAALAELGPRVVAWVSCDLATNERDLGVLVGAGYRLGSMRSYDMFPHTHHVETLAVLYRSSPT